MPDEVKHAMELRQNKAQHTEFYYKLQNLTEKIVLYKQLFYTKKPKYIRDRP